MTMTTTIIVPVGHEVRPLPVPAGRPAAQDGPVVLTAQPLLRARADLLTSLRAAQFEVRQVPTWDRLPEAAERMAPDVVLVDLDAAERRRDGDARMSGHRLVTLLARQLARRPVALVLMTQLDYAEIEDVARAGVHALVAPHLPAWLVVGHIRAGLEKARRRAVPAPVR